jgi:UDP-N-acetylmuramoyl-tripeptide--D-alanyl-D-alanine ligase
LKSVAACLPREIVSGSPETKIGGVCIDSRTAKAGDLFFAIKGEKFDGHDFIAEVAAKMSRGRRGKESRSRTQSLVVRGAGSWTMFARRWESCAAVYRKDFSLPVVAVGGSNGKTTVKELLRVRATAEISTLASEASFNNDIGVPMTLLRLENSHRAASAGSRHERIRASWRRW